MEPVLGKLKCKDTGEELKFCINPAEYRLSRNLNYQIDNCLGSSAPIVSYQGSNVTELNFSLVFDSDIDKNFEVKTVDNFLKATNKINKDTDSTPIVEFTMGGFCFRGYIKHYTYNPLRFDSKGNTTSLKITMTIISNGDYENGKS